MKLLTKMDILNEENVLSSSNELTYK